MSSPITEFDAVRVVRIDGVPEDHLASSQSLRPPRVGDLGTVVDRRDDEGGQTRFVVESTADDSRLIWLAEFRADEIELA